MTEINDIEELCQLISPPTHPPASENVITSSAEFPNQSVENLESGGLSFVAGYVAAKYRNTDRKLGEYSSFYVPSAVPSSWIMAVSRGGLMVPSEEWMSIVQSLEMIFAVVMGKTNDCNEGIMKRLMELLIEKNHH